MILYWIGEDDSHDDKVLVLIILPIIFSNILSNNFNSTYCIVFPKYELPLIYNIVLCYTYS